MLVRKWATCVCVKTISFLCLLNPKTAVVWEPVLSRFVHRMRSALSLLNLSFQELLPVYESLEQSLPDTCPLVLTRSRFYQQEEMKYREHPTKFACLICGKTFYEERFIDLHMVNRHDNIEFRVGTKIKMMLHWTGWVHLGQEMAKNQYHVCLLEGIIDFLNYCMDLPLHCIQYMRV